MIIDQVKLFWPSFGDDKITVFINFSKALVVVNCHLGTYPTEGTNIVLDNWVILKSMELIRRESDGHVKSHSIGGEFSETFIEQEGLITDMDKTFFASQMQFMDTFTYNWKTYYNDYYLMLGY